MTSPFSSATRTGRLSALGLFLSGQLSCLPPVAAAHPGELLEHPVGLARLKRQDADVVHFQWLSAPELDDRLLRSSRPLVITAHDVLPRRTAAKRELWDRLFGRFERVVVHSERGRDQLAELVGPERLRVIRTPSFLATRSGATTAARSSRSGSSASTGIGDAIEATKRPPARGRRPARQRRRLPDDSRRPGGMAARLSVRGRDRRGAGRVTVALFPYRPDSGLPTRARRGETRSLHSRGSRNAGATSGPIVRRMSEGATKADGGGSVLRRACSWPRAAYSRAMACSAFTCSMVSASPATLSGR